MAGGGFGCPRTQYLEHYNTDTQTWEVITNNKWISNWNAVNLSWTVKALGNSGVAADTPYKTNPPH